MPVARRILLLSLALALMLPATALAQGAFAGVVRDGSGGVLPGVTVEASSPALIEGTRTVVTDGTGQYRVIDLRPGVYTITFSLAGFSTVRREKLEVTGSGIVTVDAQLSVGAVTETVLVTGEAPTVDIQSTQRQHVISDDTIAALPAGRSHYDLAALIPGLNGIQFGRVGWQDVGGTNNLQIAAMSIHGGSFLDTKVAINGLSSRNLLSSSWASNFIADTGTAAEWAISYAGQGAEANSSGVTFNMVPKEGGNRFSGAVFATGANENFQSSNYTPELQARGLRAAGGLYRMYDVNPSAGGPIFRNRLWFYGSGRWQTNQFFIPGSVGNANAGNPASWFWDPDPSVRGKFNTTQNSGSIRLTYQATPRNKFSFSHEPQTRHWIDALAATSPESFTDYQFHINRFTTAGWTSPLSPRLLAEVKWADHGEGFGDRIPEEAPYNTLIVVHETGGQFVQPQHYRGRGHGGNQAVAPGYNEAPHIQQMQASLSYVTGSHNMKFGFQNEWGRADVYSQTVPASVDYYFVNRVPDRVRQWATPIHTANKLSAEMGIYAQDTWTFRRMTINGGLRFDYYANSFPEQRLEPGLFVPNRNVVFPATDFYSLKDLTPRVGLSYDLFGNGKTALKAHWGKYVGGLSAGTGNPIGNLSTNATRTWRDVNGNFQVDCNLLSNAAQDLSASGGDICGANPNASFGLSTPSTERDPDTYRGWGNRSWNQTFSVGVQHEILPRMAVDVSYYRRWEGNFGVTDNRAVTPADFTPYSVTAPTSFPGATIPLPDGAAGRTTEGFYDVIPTKFGQVNNLVTLARKFGDQSATFNGVDVTINARLRNSLVLQGGVATGSTTTDNCEIRAALPEIAPTNPYCHVEQPLLTQVKFLTTYLVPRIDVQVAATFQNNPGPVIAATYPVPVTNIVGLGRPLSSGAVNVSYDLLEPNTLYGERVTQLDIRMSKIFRMSTTRLSINFDLANLLNRNDIVGVTTVYGAAWQTPTGIIDPRLFKLGVQFDF
jgi:carboxypeptidase family protein